MPNRTTRPIIFSAPMVRALLAGRKTQTRRLASSPLAKAQPEDLLWVREAHRLTDCTCTEACRLPGNVYYEAGRNDRDRYINNRLRPSLHMPRWASRITLEVHAVSIEPLQSISRDDAIAEGIAWQEPTDEDLAWAAANGIAAADMDGVWTVPDMRTPPGRDIWGTSPEQSYRFLWNSLHTKPRERWEDNPSVVVITFSVHLHNVDRLPPEVLG